MGGLTFGHIPYWCKFLIAFLCVETNKLQTGRQKSTFFFLLLCRNWECGRGKALAAGMVVDVFGYVNDWVREERKLKVLT